MPEAGGMDELDVEAINDNRTKLLNIGRDSNMCLENVYFKHKCA